MSYTEFHCGKLKIVPKLNDETLEEQCKRLLNKELNIFEMSNFHTGWLDCFKDNFYKKYVVHNDTIYEIYDHFESDDSDYYFKIIPNDKGTLTFIGNFYNGGTCLIKCIEEELNKL